MGLSVALFGFDVWHDYLAALAGSGTVYETGRIELAGFVTPYGAARLLGVSAGAARMLQAAVSLLVVTASAGFGGVIRVRRSARRCWLRAFSLAFRWR